MLRGRRDKAETAVLTAALPFTMTESGVDLRPPHCARLTLLLLFAPLTLRGVDAV